MGNYMYHTEGKYLQSIQPLVLSIRSFNNQIAFGADGRLYFGQGTATNSGVVGEDNAALGWLQLAPKFHDIPGKDVTLAGKNFNSSNPLTMDRNQNKSTTGAFSPFGNSTAKGQIIKGDVKCNGCIIGANPDGTDLKVVGWGLRNPFGLAFEKDGKHLIVSMNGADERGSRPIANDLDKVYKIDISNSSSLGKFYGWPDYYGNAQPVTDPTFHSTRAKGPLQFVMLNHPPVEKLRIFDSKK
jgi:glucose/arabinose dehydrogenase